MRYYKVDNEEMAKQLSSLFFKLVYPDYVAPSGENNYLFGWITYQKDTLICIPNNYQMTIFIKDNFNEVIASLGEILGNVLEEGEGENLINYLKNGTIILEYIIPKQLIEVPEIEVINERIKNSNIR